MQKRIHMQDQVVNKVDSIMNHYSLNPFNLPALELWAARFVLLTAFLFIGVNWS